MSAPIVGITFPLRIVDGKIPLDRGFGVLKSSILMILGWPMFQRYFLFKFGSRLYECEEEPNDTILSAIIKTFIIEALSTWEKRIEVDPSKIFITINMISINVIVYYKVKSLSVEDFVTFTYKNN